MIRNWAAKALKRSKSLDKSQADTKPVEVPIYFWRMAIPNLHSSIFPCLKCVCVVGHHSSYSNSVIKRRANTHNAATRFAERIFLNTAVNFLKACYYERGSSSTLSYEKLSNTSDI